MSKRKNIPKSVRFEVLKRDKFTCQYCGTSAPDVILHIDHITPVASGGSDDIFNLITSCQGCNLGKSDKPLNDNSAVKKAKRQLDELQDRQEQLEMMMEWQRGLRNIADDTISKICSYWQELSPGNMVSDSGRSKLKKLVRKFTLQEIINAMNIACEQYLEYRSDGTVTNESCNLAFNKIGGICYFNNQENTSPSIREIYYIRGILRNRLGYFNNGELFERLKIAISWGVSVDTLKSIACKTRSWSAFRDDVYEETEKMCRKGEECQTA